MDNVAPVRAYFRNRAQITIRQPNPLNETAFHFDRRVKYEDNSSDVNAVDYGYRGNVLLDLAVSTGR